MVIIQFPIFGWNYSLYYGGSISSVIHIFYKSYTKLCSKNTHKRKKKRDWIILSLSCSFQYHLYQAISCHAASILIKLLHFSISDKSQIKTLVKLFSFHTHNTHSFLTWKRLHGLSKFMQTPGWRRFLLPCSHLYSQASFITLNNHNFEGGTTSEIWGMRLPLKMAAMCSSPCYTLLSLLLCYITGKRRQNLTQRCCFSGSSMAWVTYSKTERKTNNFAGQAHN